MSDARAMLDEIIRLTEAGCSRLAVARQLGLTKGQVCGAVRRHLHGIKRPLGVWKRREGSELRRAQMIALRQEQKEAAAERRRAEQDRKLAALKGQPPPGSGPPPARCQFPLGDPKKAGFHFCLARCAPGWPYCGPHVRRCYVIKSAA